MKNICVARKGVQVSNIKQCSILGFILLQFHGFNATSPQVLIAPQLHSAQTSLNSSNTRSNNCTSLSPARD